MFCANVVVLIHKTYEIIYKDDLIHINLKKSKQSSFISA